MHATDKTMKIAKSKYVVIHSGGWKVECSIIPYLYPCLVPTVGVSDPFEGKYLITILTT